MKIQERIALLDEGTTITSKSQLDGLFSSPDTSFMKSRHSPAHHVPSDLPTAQNEVHKQNETDDSTVPPSVEALGTSVIQALAELPHVDAVIKVLQASKKRRRDDA